MLLWFGLRFSIENPASRTGTDGLVLVRPPLGRRRLTLRNTVNPFLIYLQPLQTLFDLLVACHKWMKSLHFRLQAPDFPFNRHVFRELLGSTMRRANESSI